MPAVRAVRPAARAPLLDGRLRRDLEAPLEPPAACGLDLGRRGRAADLPRARSLGRGLARRDRPRASLHGGAHAARLCLPRSPLRLQLERPVTAPDGAAREAEGEGEHRLLPTAGARGATSAAALRGDPGRQRLALVRLARAEPALVERPAPLPGPPHRRRLRGRGHFLPARAREVASARPSRLWDRAAVSAPARRG